MEIEEIRKARRDLEYDLQIYLNQISIKFSKETGESIQNIETVFIKGPDKGYRLKSVSVDLGPI